MPLRIFACCIVVVDMVWMEIYAIVAVAVDVVDDEEGFLIVL